MEYTPNQELERLKKEKEENEKKVEQLDHESSVWKTASSITRTLTAKSAPTVFALWQELWKASHRQSKNWRSRR